MSSVEGGFSFSSKVMTATVVSSAGMDKGSEACFWGRFLRKRRVDNNGFKQVLMLALAESEPQVGSHFLPSQIIRGTNRLTPTFVSSLENKNEETEDEDGEIGGKFLALWTGWAIDFFFFWVGGRIMKLDDGWPAIEACLNVFLQRFLSRFSRWVYHVSKFVNRATS